MPDAIAGLYWGEDDLPPAAGTEHFLVVGSSGSGKTLLIERLLWSLLGNAGTNLSPRSRFLLYDPKQEIISRLHAMGWQKRIRILHPFDARSSAWDMAADIDGPVSARQAATLLVPERGASGGSGRDDSFFDNAVRDLLTGVMLALIDCVPNPRSWTFRDVVLAMLYEPYLRFLLSLPTTRDGPRIVPGPPAPPSNPQAGSEAEETRTFISHVGHPFSLGARLLQSYLDGQNGDRRTVANIRASINARLSVYEPIAAVWEEARRERAMFSLSEWIDGYDILVMGNDESARVALDAVNQLLFKRLTELLLSRPEMKEDDREVGEGFTWVFLDEIREAGRLDGLSRLLTKGRSKGACVVMGFQDIDGLRAVYGEEIAGEITGQCQNVAILQVSNPKTAEWATSLFGSFLTPVTSSSESYNQQGGVNLGTDRKEDTRSVLYSGDIIYLPKTGPENGLSGFFRSAHRDIRNELPLVRLDWGRRILPYLPRAVGSARDRPGVPDFIPRSQSHQYLKPWDKEDWKRLGFPGEPPSWKAESPAPRPAPPPPFTAPPAEPETPSRSSGFSSGLADLAGLASLLSALARGAFRPSATREPAREPVAPREATKARESAAPSEPESSRLAEDSNDVNNDATNNASGNDATGAGRVPFKDQVRRRRQGSASDNSTNTSNPANAVNDGSQVRPRVKPIDSISLNDFRTA